MEEVCERDNLKEALRRVQANKGSAGVDRAEGRQAVQDEGAGDHATGQRRQRGDDDSGS